MEELERDLQAALRRRPAPTGFAQRVLARIEAAPAPSAKPWWRSRGLLRPNWRWAAAAALVISLAAGSALEYQRQERARGERASQQVILALEITGSALRAVRSQIARTARAQGGER